MILRKVLQPIVGLFILVNSVCGLLFKWLQAKGLDPFVFMTGNIIVCLLTLVSFYMLYKGMKAKTTVQFMSSVYGSFLMKLVVCGLVVVLYATLAVSVNSPAIFASLFLYLVYTFIEMKGLLLLLKKD
jgi:hypothetical protein